MKVKKQKKLEMCQYDTGAHPPPPPPPTTGPSSPRCRHFAKTEVQKRAITVIIIGRFYPKSNLLCFTIIYLCIKYESNTPIFCKKNIERKTFFEGEKGP